MSFSQNVKNELCSAAAGQTCCAVAESYGALLYCHTFSHREIRIVTENRQFVKRLRALFAPAFGVDFDETRVPEGGGKISLIITNPAKLEIIADAFGFTYNETLSHHINLGVLEDEHCRISFLRGAFLAGGSVTEPRRSYHLELTTPHLAVSRETFSLFGEMEFFPKTTSRASGSVIYFKQCDKIAAFLKLIGAKENARDLLSVKEQKDLRSGVNRLVNCDLANVTKTADASERQVEAISKLIPYLSELPDKLRETAELRLNNPELSLSELAAMAVPPVTKSCLNHRMRKIIELANDCSVSL